MKDRYLFRGKRIDNDEGELKHLLQEKISFYPANHPQAPIFW
jgi:hypothetical protein